MADNTSNYLSTPDGYATPEQLKTTREYAKALLFGNMQQPIHHWTQGVSNMVSALVGGGLDYNAAQKEKGALRNQATQQQVNIPDSNFPAGGAAPVPFSGSPASAGQKNAGDPRAQAISSIETGGEKDPYHAHGPTIANPQSAYYGDKAYGKYQVMGKNIGPWTQEVFGKAMTPEEFENNPQAQEAIFKAKFQSPRQWFGRGNSDGYMTGDEYERRYNSGLAKAGGSQAMAFNGPSDVSQIPAVQAMSAALSGQPAAGPTTQVAGDPQIAAAKGTPPAPGRLLPDPAAGQPMINPQLIQKPPAYTRQQLIDVMSNPWTSPAEKQRAYEMALQQNQSQFMPSPTGSGQVLLNPNNPGQQQYFAPAPHFGKAKIGDIEVDQPGNFDPTGRYTIQTPGRTNGPATIGPRSEAEPQAAPAGAQTPPATATGGVQAALAADNSPVAPTGPANAPPAPPTQVASLDPTAGIAPAPKATPGPDVNTLVPKVADTPLAKFAQAGLPPGLKGIETIVGPDMAKAYAGKSAFDTKVAADKEAATESAKFGSKKYDTLSTQAQAARGLAPNLDMALAMMNDPNFHNGLLSGVQDVWARFKAAALGDKYANAPNEAFDKLMAGNVLGTMKTALGGLGQVRLAEIELLNKANANRYNTDASNRAVLEISKRGIEKVDQLDQIGQQYASGDEVVDPVTKQVLLKPNIGPDGEIQPRHGLDAGYDKLARKFVLDHPSFTSEEIKHYNTIFDTGRPAEGATTAPGQPAQGAAPKVGDRKQFKQGWGVWNGTEYAPETK